MSPRPDERGTSFVCDDTTTRLCPYCEGPIRRPKGKTCGDVACQTQHNREGARRSYQRRRAAGGPRRVGPQETRQCAWCGEGFVVFVSEGQRYCSLSCGNQGRKVHPHVLPHRAYGKAVVKYVRPSHASVLAPKRDQWWACVCQVCATRYVHTTHSTLCSSECERIVRREAHARAMAQRRARERGAHAEVFDRIEVFERDGYVCHLCGDMTDPEAAYPALNMPTLDHVVPLARGGHHTRANSKTAHLLCNSLKGHRETYVHDPRATAGRLDTAAVGVGGHRVPGVA